jgi:hypothetical protein
MAPGTTTSPEIATAHGVGLPVESKACFALTDAVNQRENEHGAPCTTGTNGEP